MSSTAVSAQSKGKQNIKVTKQEKTKHVEEHENENGSENENESGSDDENDLGNALNTNEVNKLTNNKVVTSKGKTVKSKEEKDKADQKKQDAKMHLLNLIKTLANRRSYQDMDSPDISDMKMLISSTLRIMSNDSVGDTMSTIYKTLCIEYIKKCQRIEKTEGIYPHDKYTQLSNSVTTKISSKKKSEPTSIRAETVIHSSAKISLSDDDEDDDMMNNGHVDKNNEKEESDDDEHDLGNNVKPQTGEAAKAKAPSKVLFPSPSNKCKTILSFLYTRYISEMMLLNTFEDSELNATLRSKMNEDSFITLMYKEGHRGFQTTPAQRSSGSILRSIAAAHFYAKSIGRQTSTIVDPIININHLNILYPPDENNRPNKKISPEVQEAFEINHYAKKCFANYVDMVAEITAKHHLWVSKEPITPEIIMSSMRILDDLCTLTCSELNKENDIPDQEIKVEYTKKDEKGNPTTVTVGTYHTRYIKAPTPLLESSPANLITMCRYVCDYLTPETDEEEKERIKQEKKAKKEQDEYDLRVMKTMKKLADKDKTLAESAKKAEEAFRKEQEEQARIEKEQKEHEERIKAQKKEEAAAKRLGKGK